MELQHRFVVPASVEVTWAALNDIAGIAPCFPGASLDSVDGDEFTGSVKIKLGPISMVYNGAGRFTERDESGHRAVIEAKGKDKRGNGTAGAKVVAQLTPDGSGTAVEVSTDLSITGKPAQFGRGVMQDVSDKLLGQFVECIAAKLGPAPERVEEVAAASSAKHAAPAVETAEPVTTAPPRADSGPAELNLASAVLPVLAKRYALPAGAAVAVIAAIIWWFKR